MDKKEKKKTKNGHVLKKWGMDFNIVCKKYNKFVIFKFFFFKYQLQIIQNYANQTMKIMSNEIFHRNENHKNARP